MRIPTSALTDISPQDRFQILIDAVKDYAIYLLDAEGHIATWNTGARRFKGYAEEEIIGRHFSLFYTEEDRVVGLPGKALATASAEGRFESEGWRLRKDGTRFTDGKRARYVQSIADTAGRATVLTGQLSHSPAASRSSPKYSTPQPGNVIWTRSSARRSVERSRSR